MQQRVAAEIVRNIHIRIAIAVIVTPSHTKGDSGFVYPGLLSYVGEVHVAVVVQQRVALAVARIEERGRKVLARVQIAAYVEIQFAVVVIVSGGGYSDEITITFRFQARAFGDVNELSFGCVLRIGDVLIKSAGAGIAAKKEIFVAVVIEIGEDADVDAGQVRRQTDVFRYVNEDAVIVLVKARLPAVAKVDVVPTVVVVINRRDPGRAVLDDAELLRLPGGRGEKRITVRHEVQTGASRDVCESSTVTSHGLTVNQLLFVDF